MVPGTIDFTYFYNTTHLFKIAFVIFFVLYFIFSLIVIKQVSLMTKTVKTEGEFLLRFLSYLHAWVVLVVIIFFLFVS